MDAAIVFPGQGSQYVGMGKDLFDNFDYVKDLFVEASDTLGRDIAHLCFTGPEAELILTENTQPTIFTASVAAYEVLKKEMGVAPKIGAGHSLGEYTALVCAGVLKFGEAVSVLEKRGRFMQEAVPPGKGSMAAIIGLSAGEVEEIITAVDGVVEIANLNGAGQIVVSGEKEAVLLAIDRAREGGAKRAIELPVSAPFHSSLMVPAAERLRPYLVDMSLGDFTFPVVANLTGRPYRKVEEVPSCLERQIFSPVRWEETVACFGKEPAGVMVEAGPGKVLTGLARRMLPGWKIGSFGSMEDRKKVEEIGIRTGG
ncbi:MAG: ACP S-malonyltransferase [Deltaproteobacteria bacterium]|nr:ACP S-malonyltransferase [Deltaproteobacteria bacterium]NIS78154.1 ACP S-malonyltransferase [Deltaproteobacteria bacterium]